MEESLKDELRRAYRVLGYRAYDQNEMDITCWVQDGYCSEKDAEELRKFNKKLSKEY